MDFFIRGLYCVISLAPEIDLLIDNKDTWIDMD